MHLVSTSRYAQKARVEIPEVTSWLMQAPQVARDKAPFYWTYLDRPDNGSIFMTWQPLQMMGTNFASDGYIWPPQEQHMRQEVGNGVVLEMYYHGAGYALNEPFATHSRRRFRLLPPNAHNPNAPQVDPSLWIVHYGPVDGNERIPVQMLPRDPRTQNILDTRAYLQRCGQIQRKEFILGDRINWPQIAWPREPSRQAMYAAGNRGVPQAIAYPPHNVAAAPPSKRARTAQAAHAQAVPPMGAILPPDNVYDDDEDTSRGDMFDHMTPREISQARYRQNHEWMEEILSSPYRMGQIGFTSLGLGLKGELSALTEGILPAQGIEALDSAPAQPAGHLEPEKAAEFRKRVNERIESTNAEMAKLKAEHEKKMARFKKHSLLTTAEKDLRTAVDDASSGPLSLERRSEEAEDGSTRWTSKHSKSVDDIVSQVEAQLGRRAEVMHDLKRIQDGGYQEPVPEPEQPALVQPSTAGPGPTGENEMSRQGSQHSAMMGGESDVDMGGTASTLLDQMHTGLSSTSTPGGNNFATPQGPVSGMPSSAATPVHLNVPSPGAAAAPPAPGPNQTGGDVSMSGTDDHPPAGTAPDHGTGSGEWVVVPKGGETPDPNAAAAPASNPPADVPVSEAAHPMPDQQQTPVAVGAGSAGNDNDSGNKSAGDTPAAAGNMGFDTENDFGSLEDLDTAGDALAGFGTDTPGELGGDFMEDSAFGDAFHGVESAGGGAEAGDNGTPAADGTM